MSEGSRPPSIRRRLLLFLIGSLLLVLSGAALVTYLVAVNAANNAYDRSLLDPVLDIADNVKVDTAGAHLDLPQKALEALRTSAPARAGSCRVSNTVPKPSGQSCSTCRPRTSASGR